MLKPGGSAAVVVPDNVLFEAGAGEKIRRALLEQCDVHTLLRLPTGIWYSTGVKANVLFFDKCSTSKANHAKELWVYDLRTNKNFTLRQKPIGDDDLKDFVDVYEAAKKGHRKDSERFRRFTYADIMARDKANLDIFWLKDESFVVTALLPHPEAIATEIIADLEEALKQYRIAETELQSGN
jgi:type I restriction enzyme M protein